MTKYEGTPDIMKLETLESPRQILSEDFPRHQWPISGGWGYTKDSAVVLEIDDADDGIAIEYKFLEYRSYEEGIIFRPKGQQMAGFRFKNKMQYLIHDDDGKPYDHVVMEVTAYKENDYNFLSDDWEQHNGYEGDPDGMNKHLQLADSKMIRYEIEGYFDISRFFGKP